MSTLVTFWTNLWHPAVSIDTDIAPQIDEELLFHFRALVDDNSARGMSPDNAWADAQRRFGSIERYAKETWRVDMATQLTIQRVAIIALLLLALLCGWLWLQVENLHGQNTQIMQIMKGMVPAKPEDQDPQLADFVGSVLDESGKPLPDADLLVILKTWPGGQYMQQDFYAKSDSDGHFSLPKLVPVNRQYAVQVAAAKKGYAFKSAYQMKQGAAVKEPQPAKFRLEKAFPLTLVIRDKAGQPIPEAVAVPNSRKPQGGQEQSIYFQASEPLHCDANDQGEISLPYFAAGDRVTINLQIPGRDWEPHSFVVQEKNNPYTITVEKAN
jgi:hypothetical protein